MTKLPLISMVLTFAVSVVTVGSATAASNCDALRLQIQAKIAASGVANVTVTIVDADAASGMRGKVVGSCEMGAKSIVYEQFDTPVSPAASGSTTSAPNIGGVDARPKKDPILTECKDGSVSAGGDCKN